MTSIIDLGIEASDVNVTIANTMSVSETSVRIVLNRLFFMF